jgi:hypothetical protein
MQAGKAEKQPPTHSTGDTAYADSTAKVTCVSCSQSTLVSSKHVGVAVQRVQFSVGTLNVETAPKKQSRYNHALTVPLVGLDAEPQRRFKYFP